MDEGHGGEGGGGEGGGAEHEPSDEDGFREGARCRRPEGPTLGSSRLPSEARTLSIRTW
jgi:hypothetical protein